uniref:Uncharacterized protein n=1 Tax=viral metagenome TaxID=1070528 RepID=A0A6C0EB10_9ZZZZ
MEQSTLKNNALCYEYTFSATYKDYPNHTIVRHVIREYDHSLCAFVTKITTKTYHYGECINSHSTYQYSHLIYQDYSSSWYPNHTQLQTKTAPALKYHESWHHSQHNAPHAKPSYTYTPSITIFLKNSKMAIALGLVPLKKSRTKRSQKPPRIHF